MEPDHFDIFDAIEVIEGRLDGLSLDAPDLTNLDAPVSSRASQDSADAIEAKLDAGLDATVSSRASGADLDTAEFNIVQAITNTDEGSRQINSFQVFELKEKRRWLLVLAESGQRVDATLTKLMVARDHKKNDPLTWVDVTFEVTATDTGLLDVSLDKDKKDKDVDKADLFLFEVEHDHGGFMHFGITVIDRRVHKP